MPTTVAQHRAGLVAAFTTPSPGGDLDANVVRGNDNSIRAQYIDHDADPGIHLQSSDLASRPTAGTAGVKWMTVDGTAIRIFYDNGTDWVEASYIAVGSAPTLSGLTLTGAANFQDNLLTRPVIKDYGETSTAPTISGNALTLNLENGNVFRVALNADINTLNIQNPSASGTACSFTVAFTANGVSRTINWPPAVKWAAGVSPTMTATNGKVDILTFVTWDAGTNWYGFVAGQNF